jgi:hypothetical protein
MNVDTTSYRAQAANSARDTALARWLASYEPIDEERFVTLFTAYSISHRAIFIMQMPGTTLPCFLWSNRAKWAGSKQAAWCDVHFEIDSPDLVPGYLFVLYTAVLCKPQQKRTICVSERDG